MIYSAFLFFILKLYPTVDNPIKKYRQAFCWAYFPPFPSVFDIARITSCAFFLTGVT